VRVVVYVSLCACMCVCVCVCVVQNTLGCNDILKRGVCLRLLSLFLSMSLFL